MSNPKHTAPQHGRSQRELVGLALHRGARIPAAPPAANAQRDRVRLALALGVGRAQAKRR